MTDQEPEHIAPVISLDVWRHRRVIFLMPAPQPERSTTK